AGFLYACWRGIMKAMVPVIILLALISLKWTDVLANSSNVLSVDVGTTGVKVALIDGKTLAQIGPGAYSRYESGTLARITDGENGYLEQVPEDWYNAFCDASKELLSQLNEELKPCAIVLSGQMQDTIPVSTTDDEALCNAILYSDSRARLEAERIEKKFGGPEGMQQLTGLYTGASSVLAKLMWLKKNQKKIYSSCSKVLLGAHSYVCWRLTGEARCDYTTASTTGLLDVRQWPPVWLEKEMAELGLDSSKLPELESALQVTAPLKEKAAKQLGLQPGIPVIHGSGDMGSTSVGAGAGTAGGAYIYIGTSGWVAVARDGYQPTAAGGFTMLHPDPELCLQVASMMTAGGNVEFFLSILGDALPGKTISEKIQQLDVLAAASPPGANGVIYLPYIAGERSPFNDPDIRGGFLGLGVSTRRADLCRAVLEGVALAYRHLLEVVGGGAAASAEALTVVGGGARSALWLQILADATGRPVAAAAAAGSGGADVAAVGAARMAAAALGW
ncbi:unnamed protein product, partial [Heterosigma akashiwo]